MPAKYQRCVRKVARTVKPRRGRTKLESAHAICTARNVGKVKQYRARKKGARKKK